MELVNKNRCVIIGGGNVSDNSIIKSNIFYDDFVIAADKGYEYCLSASVVPDLIVGDFDSTTEPTTDIQTIVLNPVKDCTDMEFAINEAVKLGFKNIMVLGGLGGRADQSFANFTLVAEFRQKNINITLVDENHRIFALKDETRTLVNENKYVSVFAFGGSCNVTEEGFFYPLDNYLMTSFDALGVSNEIVGKTATITINNGTAIIMEVNRNI